MSDGRHHTDSFEAYTRELSSSKPLSSEEETQLADRIRAGDFEARDQLATANLRFVFRVAHEFRYQGLPLEDLVGAGNVGILTAAERFDASHGCRFITYAVHWIRQAMRQAVIRHSRMVRLPSNQVEQIRKLGRASSDLANEGEVVDSRERLAEDLGITPERVDQLRQAAQPTVAIDPVALEDGAGLFGNLTDQLAGGPDADVIRESVGAAVESAFEILGERERSILRQYYGFGGEEPLSLEAVGKRVGLTRERVRQIKSGALEKLRRSRMAPELRTCLEE